MIGVNQLCSSLFPFNDWSLGARDLVVANEPQGKSPGGCGKDSFPPQIETSEGESLFYGVRHEVGVAPGVVASHGQGRGAEGGKRLGL